MRAVSIVVAIGCLACAEARSAQQPPAEQVAEAVLAAPEPLRASASVLGYGPEGGLEVLREGDGPLRCLADDPAEDGFHVACYHQDLEPYMARGRELRAGGLSSRDALARRWEELEAGRLEFPDGPAALYSLTGDRRPATDPAALRRLTVIYVPYATPERMGLPAAPEAGGPWLMFPGTPTAHVMIGG